MAMNLPHESSVSVPITERAEAFRPFQDYPTGTPLIILCVITLAHFPSFHYLCHTPTLFDILFIFSTSRKYIKLPRKQYDSFCRHVGSLPVTTAPEEANILLSNKRLSICCHGRHRWRPYNDTPCQPTNSTFSQVSQVSHISHLSQKIHPSHPSHSISNSESFKSSESSDN